MTESESCQVGAEKGNSHLSVLNVRAYTERAVSLNIRYNLMLRCVMLTCELVFNALFINVEER